MTDIDLVKLKERYSVPEVPKCRVCGGELTLQRAGDGPTIWGCSGMIDDPTGERNWIYAEGRSCADEHYERSRWSDYRRGGDSDVIALIEQLEATQRERDELTHKDYLTWHAAACKFRQRAESAEAELKRRDEQEPVPKLSPERITEIMQDAWNEWCDDTGCYPDDFEYKNEQLFFDAGRWAYLIAERVVNAAAHAAVIPPEKRKLENAPEYLEKGAKLTWMSGYNQAILDAKTLGCQPEKVVKLPPAEKDGGTDWQGDITAGCVNRMRDRCIAALAAAGVKWVEGE